MVMIYFLWQNVTAVAQKYVQELWKEVLNVCAEMDIHYMKILKHAQVAKYNISESYWC